MGLPEPLPDVTGLALRFAEGGALLFASTGTGPFTRRLLALRVPGAVVRFDPLRPPVGLWWSDFWAAARGPAYALARRLTPGAP